MISFISTLGLDRKNNGMKYKASSIENWRHSLNRYLQTPPFERNIYMIKDAAFRESNLSYRAAIKELKSDEGKGKTKHYPIISDADMHKLHT